MLVPTPLVYGTPQLEPSAYAVVVAAPEGREMSAWILTYRAVADVLRHNGITATPAEIEETAARLTADGQLDFTSRVDGDGNLRPNLGDGTWLAAGQHRTTDGREARGYNLHMHPQFQQQVLTNYGSLTPEVRGQRGLVEMRMTERMTTAAGIAWERYLTPEVRRALGDITPEQLAIVVAVGGTTGIVGRTTAARTLLGPVGAVAGMYDLTRRYQSAQRFIDLTGAARTQADLDRAAQQFARMASELVAGGVRRRVSHRRCRSSRALIADYFGGCANHCFQV